MKNREQLRAGKPTAPSGDPYLVLGAPLPVAENAGTLQPQRSPLNFTLWNDWLDDVLISYGHTPLVGVRGLSSIAKGNHASALTTTTPKGRECTR